MPRQKRSRKQIQPDQIWISKSAYRRVIAVHDDRVTYCNGGDHHHHCNIETFMEATAPGKGFKLSTGKQPPKRKTDLV